MFGLVIQMPEITHSSIVVWCRFTTKWAFSTPNAQSHDTNPSLRDVKRANEHASYMPNQHLGATRGTEFAVQCRHGLPPSAGGSERKKRAENGHATRERLNAVKRLRECAKLYAERAPRRRSPSRTRALAAVCFTYSQKGHSNAKNT